MSRNIIKLTQTNIHSDKLTPVLIGVNHISNAYPEPESSLIGRTKVWFSNDESITVTETQDEILAMINGEDEPSETINCTCCDRINSETDGRLTICHKCLAEARMRWEENNKASEPEDEQAAPDGNNCAICGDNDHQAFECHHKSAPGKVVAGEGWKDRMARLREKLLNTYDTCYDLHGRTPNDLEDFDLLVSEVTEKGTPDVQ